MTNITSVTNPTPGQDNSANYRSPIAPNDPQVKNVSDPSRITRADQRSDRQDTAGSGLARRYDSYFQAFLQELRSFGSISDSLYQFLLSGFTMQGDVGGAGLNPALAQLFQGLQVNPEQLLTLLKGMMSADQRFRGPLFDVLRDALRHGASQGMKEDIAQFLRKFSDFSATPHIERSLARNIQQMSWFMPQRFSDALDGHLRQLNTLLAKSDRAGALALLQKTFLPYMSDYVSQVHDRGIARNLLSMLVLDIARYENGSPQNLLQSFYQLFSYTPIKDAFGNLDQNAILQMLSEHTAPPNDASTSILDQLSELSARTMRGEGSTSLQQTLQELMRSVLVNQSVFMPLAHAMLPIIMDGKAMFSELWVDADAEQQSNGRSASKEMRMLLKFDIQDLGNFDLVITYHDDGVVDAQLNCPPHLTQFTDLFASKMTKMAENAGLKPSAIRASPATRRTTLTEVFPKILERMNSLNVTI